MKFAPYKDFVRACDRDPKLELLSEQNNMYRTLCALFLALPAFKGGLTCSHDTWASPRPLNY